MDENSASIAIKMLTCIEYATSESRCAFFAASICDCEKKGTVTCVEFGSSVDVAGRVSVDVSVSVSAAAPSQTRGCTDDIRKRDAKLDRACLNVGIGCIMDSFD